ncbi:hypothetical protein CBL_20454 [Carabus blaptoides fortunei]
MAQPQYDKGSKDLKPLKIGDNVKVQFDKSRENGKIADKVELENGSTVNRNRMKMPKKRMDFWRVMEIVPDLKRDKWHFSEVYLTCTESRVTSKSNLTPTQHHLLENLLDGHFTRNKSSSGCTTLVQHSIATAPPPIKQ